VGKALLDGPGWDGRGLKAAIPINSPVGGASRGKDREGEDVGEASYLVCFESPGPSTGCSLLHREKEDEGNGHRGMSIGQLSLPDRRLAFACRNRDPRSGGKKSKGKAGKVNSSEEKKTSDQCCTPWSDDIRPMSRVKEVMRKGGPESMILGVPFVPPRNTPPRHREGTLKKEIGRKGRIPGVAAGKREPIKRLGKDRVVLWKGKETKSGGGLGSTTAQAWAVTKKDDRVYHATISWGGG